MTKQQLNTFITNNNKQFAAGSTFSATDLAKWFNIPLSGNINSNNMKLLSAYTSLNRLLKTRGLVVKSKNYYSEFHIKGGIEAARHVNNLKKSGANKIASATLLSVGITKHHSTWSKKISKKDLKAIPFTALFGN